MKKAFVFAAVVCAFAINAQANTSNKYYDITSMQTQEVASGPMDMAKVMEMSQNCDQGLMASRAGGPFDDVELAIDQIINIGKKIWNIIAAGKPVMNYQTDIATALPKGVKCWMDLASWQVPMTKTYRFTAQNAFGMEVVKFDYRIIYVYGGNVEGKGQYIGYATTQPVDMVVQWGFALNATGSVPTVFNTGTRTEPVGAMQLDMAYRIDSPMTAIQQTQAYYISGAGDFQKLK